MKNKRKLVITIPCLNEEKSLPAVLESIPKKIRGIEKIDVVVINDGSTDQTVEIAKKHNAFIINHKRNLGLARSFEDGIKKALDLGADIIVNTDGDNQYNQKEIPKLIRPIIEDTADMVLGDRQIKKLNQMPFGKKIGNIFGSWIVRKLTNSNIKDASTGFRAFNREIVQSFHSISQHTYTHETIIQSVFQGFTVTQVPVEFKKRKDGQSRLIKNVWSHIKVSAVVIVRTILIYRAFKFLSLIGLSIIGLGMTGIVRFFWFYFKGEGNGHVQSLIFSSILIGIGFNAFTLSILADLIGLNRKIIEKVLKSHD